MYPTTKGCDTAWMSNRKFFRKKDLEALLEFREGEEPGEKESNKSIQTPFLYPDGDIIDIFFQGEENTGTLTDLVETLRWLRMQTVTHRQYNKKSKLIANICLTINLEFYN